MTSSVQSFRRSRSRRARFLGLGAALAFLLFGGLVLRWMYQSAYQNAQTLATLEAEIVAASIATELRNAELMAQTLPRLSLDEIQSQQEFANRVDTLVRMAGAGVSVQWSPQAVVRFVHPLAGNEAAVGLDLRRDPQSRAIILQMITRNEPRWDGPLNLRQGGVGMLYRHPLYQTDAAPSEQSFTGLATSLVNLSALLGELSKRSQRHHLQAWITGIDASRKAVWGSDDASIDSGPFGTARVSLGNSTESNASAARFSIEVVAKPRGFVDEQHTTARLLALLISATMFGLLVFAVANQRVTRRAMRSAETLQQAMLDNETAAIVRVRDRHIIWANRAFELMMGYGPGEMNGMHTRENYPDEATYTAFGAACYPVLMAGGTYRTEVEHRRKDGSPIFLDIAGHALEGSPGETLWTMIDITERQRAQEQVQALSETRLAQSEARLRRMVVLSSCWYWETDADLRFTVIGDVGDESARVPLPIETFRRMTLGRRRWEIEGLEPVSGSWDEHREQMTKHQTFQDFEYTIDRDGQRRWVRVSGEPIIDTDGAFKGYRGVGRDVTAERLAEMQLRSMQATELIGQLTGGLAHDFRNMLNVVLGSLDQLDDDIGADAQNERRMITIAQSAALKGVALTESLLAIARRQPLQLSRHDLNELLRDVEALVKTAVGGRVLVELDLSEEPLAVRVDAAALSNVVLNLAINARDAMQEQAGAHHLILRSRRVSVGESSSARVKELLAGSYAVIEVSDNGPGMSPQILAKVFEPFFTTKPAGKGTGLGLAMVHGFAEQLGGKVDIESHLGTGTTVFVYLPLIPLSANADTARA